MARCSRNPGEREFRFIATRRITDRTPISPADAGCHRSPPPGRLSALSAAAFLWAVTLWASLVVPSPVLAEDPAVRLTEYRFEDHGDWRWASRGGRVPTTEPLVEHFGESLREIRRALASREPRPILVVYTAQRKEFEDVVQRFGAETPPPYTLAMAFPSRGVMVLDGARLRSQPVGGFPETVVHEIAHLVLGAGGGEVPRWYHEGLAQWLSGARIDWETRNLLALLARKDGLIPLVEMARSFPASHRLNSISYRQSLSFVTFMNRRYGETVHQRMLVEFSRGSGVEEAFARATGQPLLEAEQEWLGALAREFSWLRFIIGSLGLFQILAIGVIIGYISQRFRRRRALARMAAEEEAAPDFGE